MLKYSNDYFSAFNYVLLKNQVSRKKKSVLDRFLENISDIWDASIQALFLFVSTGEVIRCIRYYMHYVSTYSLICCCSCSGQKMQKEIEKALFCVSIMTKQTWKHFTNIFFHGGKVKYKQDIGRYV